MLSIIIMIKSYYINFIHFDGHVKYYYNDYILQFKQSTEDGC